MATKKPPERQAEVDGLDMGILSDGTQFLTGRALGPMRGSSAADRVQPRRVDDTHTSAVIVEA
jgi:hypothetical protein